MHTNNFSSLGDVGRVRTEEDVKNKIVIPYLKKLGYSLEDMEFEKTIRVGRNTVVRPDIVVNVLSQARIVADTKKPKTPLEKYAEQVISYARMLLAPYAMLSNGGAIQMYDAISKNRIEQIPTREEIIKIRQEVSEKQKEDAKETIIKFESIKELSGVLGKCENLIRDKDGLTGADAFDEFIKLIFIKMHEEKLKKEVGGENRFDPIQLSVIKKKEGLESLTDAANHLYDKVLNNNDYADIFEDKNDKIRLSPFTINKISQYFSEYTLVDTEVDIKGDAFEMFLGKTFTGKLGQFFTPREVIKFVVYTIDPKINETIIDPACGSGGFLIESFKQVEKEIKDSFSGEKKEKYKRNLVDNCLFGTDKDPRIVKVAKMNMVLHGDGHGRIYRYEGLLNFGEIRENKFDVVLTNPPFGSVVKDPEILREYVLGHRKGWDRKDKGSDLRKKQYHEVLFLERCINLLDAGGRMAIVLPDGVLNNIMLEYVRDFIREKTEVIAVISLPKGTFQPYGSGVKASVLYLKKKRSKDERQGKVFMANIEDVGYDITRNKRIDIDQNDLEINEEVYTNFREFLKGK
jgi:type I restriction enzyme M protein